MAATYKDYRVRYQDGIFTLYDEERHLVNAPVLESIIDGLEQTLHHLRAGRTQAELIVDAQQDWLAHILDTATILRGNPLTSLTFRGTYPTVLPQSGSGVYCFRHPSRPAKVKIGSTKDLFTRTKDFYWKLGEAPVELLLFIQTPEYRRLEILLLAGFDTPDEWVEESDALRIIEALASSPHEDAYAQNKQ